MATVETKMPALPETNGREAEHGIEITRDVIIDLRNSVVTELQLSDISDDVGTCWRELGPKLDISAAKIQNLDDDYRCNRDKANALLLMWKQKEGSSAVVERLVDALESIGKKCIAEKLLGLDDGKLPRCGNIPKGYAISLTVIHNLGAGLDKLLVCEDAQGNKYMVKAFNSSDKLLKLEETLVSRRFLETVVEARQESLKRYISSELQDLRLQLACRNEDTSDAELTSSSSDDEEVDPPNEENVGHLLLSCEEHRNFCQRMLGTLIKLTAEAGRQSEDNVKRVQELWDLAMEYRQQDLTLFSKIEFVRTQSQLSDKQLTGRVEELQKWKTQHEVQFKDVEKLLSGLLHQGSMDRRPNIQGRPKSSHRKTVPERTLKALPGHGRKKPRHFSVGDPPREIGTKNRLSWLTSDRDKEPCILLSITKPSNDKEH
ncbi:uncharacterized protein LOC111330978 isoform X2 [Stylophora pistillata]|uniref:uncharacterized protein LOC111330978 isoform X2 n=1 Tax=Stylophora pistillata TaxID=50429 RepID=UPI000C039227|nr:uncharacterized protein LOC111330978 isoform X2 [Stylophora pistillata]